MSKNSLMLKHLADLKHIKLDGLRFRLVDADGQIVGHLAQQIAFILQGKDKPIYSPKRNHGDVVVVVNAAKVHFTHDSWESKLYRWHTGYPGGLKERKAVDVWERNPSLIISEAVRGMLPKDKWRVFRMDKLKVFAGEEHPFQDFDLVPFVPRPRQIRAPNLGWSLPQGFEPMNPSIFGHRMKASPEVRAAPRKEIDFSDLLTEEERRLVAAAQAAGKQ